MNFKQTELKPSELIKKELKERHISQKNFANAIGVSESHLSDILSGRRRITYSFASKAEKLLDIDSRVILEMQTANDIVCKSNHCINNSELDAKLKLDTIDSVVSVKRLLGFLKKKFKTNMDKLNALRNYYGLSSDVSNIIEKMALGCYRKSSSTGMDIRMIYSWVVIAHSISRTVRPTGVFSIEKMNELCVKVAKKLHNNEPNLINSLILLLSEYGIGLLRVDKLERASIDGYSFFNDDIPYIALTCRYDRIDNLAFTLLHELAHIALGHTTNKSSQLNIDRRSYDEEYYDKIENDANKYASEMLIPHHIWQFAPIIPAIPAVIKARYKKWAESLDLNPWIVLGRLSYETGIYKFPTDESRKINGGKEVCNELNI